MKTSLKHSLVALALVFALGAAPLRGFAQDNGTSNKNISHIDLQSADIRDALRQLFKDVGVDYSIDDSVQGTVTLTIDNKPFETVLQAILGQVGATYRIEGGIYHIILKQQENLPTSSSTTQNTAPTEETVTRRILIQHADPELIFKLLSGKIQTVSGSIPETSAITNAQLARSLGGGGMGGGMGGMGGGMGGMGGGMGGMGGGMGGMGGGMMGGMGGGMGGMGGGFGGGGMGGGGGYGGGF